MNCVCKFAAVLGALLNLVGCASSSGVVRNASPILMSKPVTLDFVFVATTSSVGDLETEKDLLNDLTVSGLKETELFPGVSANKTDALLGDGIKVAADIREIHKVSDNARAWAGALAGQARISVQVTVSDLKSDAPIESFEIEGKSGKSAFAGTTDEAIERAAEQIVAEIVKLNAQTSQWY